MPKKRPARKSRKRASPAKRRKTVARKAQRAAPRRTPKKKAKPGKKLRRTATNVRPVKRGKSSAPVRKRRAPRLSPLAAKDARDLAFAERAKKAAAKRERADREATIRLVMKRGKVSRKEAVRRYDAGLRRSRRDAIFSPADVARDRTAERFKFRRRPDGSLDTETVWEKNRKGNWLPSSPERVKRVRAAYLREARYRQIAQVLDVDVKTAKTLVRENYGGEVRNALVQVVYQRLAGKGERRDGPVHYSDADRIEEEETDGAED